MEHGRKAAVILTDLLRAFLLGLALCLCVGGVFFLIGLCTSGAAQGLENAKNSLFLLTAAVMFLIAGLLMAKGKKIEKPVEQPLWRKHFRLVNVRAVAAMVGAAALCAASLLDLIQRL